MKAKIKNTGEIINIYECATIELAVYDSDGYPIRVRPEDIELIPDDKDDNLPKIDWEQRRYELAKAAMVAMLCGELISRREMTTERIVGIANNIIEELKKINNERI